MFMDLMTMTDIACQSRAFLTNLSACQLQGRNGSASSEPGSEPLQTMTCMVAYMDYECWNKVDPPWLPLGKAEVQVH